LEINETLFGKCLTGGIFVIITRVVSTVWKMPYRGDICKE
jgi:hypothetical protein